MAQSSIAVVGATGYAGAEIVRLLSRHPCAKVTTVTSSRSAGKPLQSECPWLDTDLTLTEFDPDKIEADIVFLCQESGFAMRHARKLIERTRVIDMSADFRLTDQDAYKNYYKAEHLDFGLKAVYGLPEIVDPEEIAEAKLVANPGCFPTATLLGLYPLALYDLIGGVPVVDAKSGVSGAGRSRTETDYTFSELDGGFKAYAVNGHRHTPEIEQWANRPVRFTPHLLPIARGLHATIHVPLNKDADLAQVYYEYYVHSRFVKVVPDKPSTKHVLGSNRCLINVEHDKRLNYAVICSVIDNLGKGAAGQAIQNMNLMLGLPEDAGLQTDGVWP